MLSKINTVTFIEDTDTMFAFAMPEFLLGRVVSIIQQKNVQDGNAMDIEAIKLKHGLGEPARDGTVRHLIDME